MCQDACVRMQVACIKAAFAKPDELKIAPPPEVEKLKSAAKALQDQAAKLGGSETSEAEKPAPSSGGGGMMGAMMGAATAAAGAAAGVAKAGAAGAATAAAAGLDKLVDGLEKPFNTVAQDVVSKKEQELYNICVAYINGYKFLTPTALARGGAIDGSDFKKSYENYNGDAISKSLADNAGAALCDKLFPEVTAAIKGHLVTTGWDKAQKAYTTAYNAICSVMKAEDLAKVGIVPVQCEVNRYVTVQIWASLAKLMAAEELSIRKMSEPDKRKKDITVPKKPVSFALVFSDQPIMASHYNFWKEETEQ